MKRNVKVESFFIWANQYLNKRMNEGYVCVYIFKGNANIIREWVSFRQTSFHFLNLTFSPTMVLMLSLPSSLSFTQMSFSLGLCFPT